MAVVICFFLCWAPFHAQRLIAVYGTGVIAGDSDSDAVAAAADGIEGSGRDTDYKATTGSGTEGVTGLETTEDSHTSSSNHDHEIIYTVMTYVSGVLYYLSTCINPLLYNLMSNKFRQAFKVCEM